MLRRTPTQVAGWTIAAMLLALVAASLTRPYESLRETAWDWATMRAAPTDPAPVVVVDIDRATLAELGPWPWPRSRLATVLSRIAEARPRAVAIDIVLEGADERSPAGLSRKLAEAVPKAAEALKPLALEDGDALLAAAIAKAPAVLGLALDADRDGARFPAVPMLSRGKPDLQRIWAVRGMIGPGDTLLRPAAGLGVVALPGDADGRIRRVPLLVSSGGRLHAGLAADVARVAAEASAYMLTAAPPALGIGASRLRLSPDGMLRLRPSREAGREARTISCRDLLAGRFDPASLAARLADRVVIVGSSAPEAGGLRTAAFGRLVASAELQADAVAQIMTGDSPWRPGALRLGETLIALVAGAGAALAGLRWPPYRGGVATALAATTWLAACLAAVKISGLLVDPLLPLGALAIAHPIAALGAATALSRREEAVRRRFEQHLSPAVVRQLVERPDLMRLEGEAREVTAMFTDIEGFTDLTERCDPRTMVAMLDRYFEGAAKIVVEHGGMIEKFVGDALHVLFNAPLDLADHPEAAVRCAEALVAFTERLRTEPQPKELGFGRTRVGIETGLVVVGDVGGGRRLDYTAHGRSMNMAARLEAANKELGSSICVGPGTAARLGADRLRSLGRIRLKGFADAVEAREPWPADYGPEDRRTYSDALATLDSDPAAARAKLSALGVAFPRDLALRRLLERA